MTRNDDKLDRTLWWIGWLVLAIGCLFLLMGYCTGCVADRLDVVAGRVDRVSQDISVLKAEVALSAGGDINEPVTGWILAAGFAIGIPGCFLAYMFSHRVPGFKWVKDKIRGS